MLWFGVERMLTKYENIAQKIRLLLYAQPMSMSEISYRITNSRITNHGYPSSSIRGRLSEMRKRGLVEKQTRSGKKEFGLTDTGKKYRENEGTINNEM